MKITTEVNRPSHISDLEELVTIQAVSSPYLNAENSVRVSLFRDGKEVGTVIPLVLFMAVKAKIMLTENIDVEPEDLSKKTLKHIRTVLAEIRSSAHNSDALIGKSLHRKLFNYVVFNESMMVDPDDDILENNSRNKAHTVSNIKCPSFTLPGYLCQWLISVVKLHKDSSYNKLNAELKLKARALYSEIENVYEESLSGGFSRRMQNKIMLQAFDTALGPKLRELKFLNPAFI